MQNFHKNAKFSQKCKICQKFSQKCKIFQKFFKNFQNFVTFKTLFWPWRRHYNILHVRTFFVEKRKVNWRPGKNSKFQTKYHKTRIQSILNMTKFWKNFFQKIKNFKKCKIFPNSQKCKFFQNFPKIAKFSKNCKIFQKLQNFPKFSKKWENFPKNEKISHKNVKNFPKILKFFKILSLLKRSFDHEDVILTYYM